MQSAERSQNTRCVRQCSVTVFSSEMVMQMISECSRQRKEKVQGKMYTQRICRVLKGARYLLRKFLIFLVLAAKGGWKAELRCCLFYCRTRIGGGMMTFSALYQLSMRVHHLVVVLPLQNVNRCLTHRAQKTNHCSRDRTPTVQLLTANKHLLLLRLLLHAPMAV